MMRAFSSLLLVIALVSSAQAQQRASAPAEETPTVTLWGLAALSGDKTALAELTRRGNAGNADAQFFLGSMSSVGEGVPKDAAQAVSWFRRSAEQGNSDAQEFLGLMYENGDGLLKDYVQAANWYRKAAEQNKEMAQYRLGYLYGTGQGVPKDLVTAYMWVNLAAAQGYKDSGNTRDALEKQMTPAQIAEGQKMSREWKPKK
jgi:uncharacterized protein